MRSLDTRVDSFMRAPAAAAMFVLADRLGLSAERLAAPASATALASTALRDLNPWTGQAAANRARALALVQPLRDPVTEVVTDLRNAWWSAPLDRGAQLLLTGQDDPQRDPMHLQPPEGPIDTWETYAQKPLRSIATSTELPVAHDEPIRSGAHAELACGSSDWDAVYPVHQVRLRVSSTARVYQVDSAADWHRLVQRYGDWATRPGSDDNLRDAAGIDNGPAPTWSRVADDYDGVHLTFAGLLTGLYVPHTTEEVTTTLWAWNWESTHWLRSVFTSATTLDDLPQAPEDPTTTARSEEPTSQQPVAREHLSPPGSHVDEPDITRERRSPALGCSVCGARQPHGGSAVTTPAAAVTGQPRSTARHEAAPWRTAVVCWIWMVRGEGNGTKES